MNLLYDLRYEVVGLAWVGLLCGYCVGVAVDEMMTGRRWK